MFTLVLEKGFRPAPLGEGAFRFTAQITFSDAGSGKTLYRSRVMHANREDRNAHARMGFTEGWGPLLRSWMSCSRQLTKMLRLSLRTEHAGACLRPGWS